MGSSSPGVHVSQKARILSTFDSGAGSRCGHRPPTVFCAPVSVPGYGEGTLTFTDESFEPIFRSCAEYSGTAVIEFVDADIDPIVMAESGLVRFPGNSFNAPGGFQSFGNPFHQTGTFVVGDGPAELIGLTGTSDVSLAGAGLRGVYTIELE